MCGITGIVACESCDLGKTLVRMTDALKHRGPDGYGYVSLQSGASFDEPALYNVPQNPEKVFFGHRRLNIIDLEGSRQPLGNEDGSVWVTFNGEIYNYKELRECLSKKGHHIREAGDTEVLVHLWEEYGEEMPEHLTGMFAFGIYDTRKDILFLARDRFGQKPLYYWHNSKSFSFASELQALWEMENFPFNEFDRVSVTQYFRYGYIPNPRTIYSGVYCLPPGHTLTLKNGNVSLKRYYKPSVNGIKGQCNLEELEDELDRSVSLRMISDVPLGAFLSGGIDSSLIVASMSKQSEVPVKTFTISTGNNWFDESETARTVAEYIGTEHHEFLVKPDFVAVAQKLARHYGQPFADYSCVPTYYISRETRKKVTVALSGDGGDELFAGYNRYANYFYTKMAGAIPFSLRIPMALFARKFTIKNHHFAGWVSNYILSAGLLPLKGENHSGLYHNYLRKQVFTDDFIKDLSDLEYQEIEAFSRLFAIAESENPLERWLEVDQRIYLPDDILTKVDIASMAVSLECRAPFPDHHFTELANRISIQKKISRGQTKLPLRRLAQKRIPVGISNLPKKGFNLPLSLWLRSSLKDWAYENLFKNQSWSSYLKHSAVENLWNEHQTGKIDHSMRLWMIIAWNLWSESISSPLN